MRMDSSPGQAGPPTRLAAIIRDEGRKQSWLSERTGINPSRLSFIVNGLRPRDDEATAIAGALGRPVEDVFPPEAVPA